MGDHLCKKCSKEFKNNYTLKRHINNIHENKSGSKTAKKIIFTCKECGYETGRKDALNRHMKSKRCKTNKMKMIKKNKTINKTKGIINSKINGDHNKNKITVNNDKINIGKLNVILLNFPPDKYTVLKDLPKILQSNENIIISMIKKTNLNKEKPEHHNIYYPDIKKSHGEIYKNNKWKIKNMDEIINTIIEAKTEDLSAILDEFGGIFNDKAKKRIQEIKKEFYDTKSRKMLAKHLKLLFFGKKDMIKKTKDMTSKPKLDNSEELEEDNNEESEEKEMLKQKTKKKIIESDSDDENSDEK